MPLRSQPQLVLSAQSHQQSECAVQAPCRYLGLVHFGIAFAVLVLGRARRVNNRRIDHRALAQQPAAVAQIAVDDLQNPARQLMFLQQAPEVENRVSSGIRSRLKPANWRRIVVSRCLRHPRYSIPSAPNGGNHHPDYQLPRCLCR